MRFSRQQMKKFLMLMSVMLFAAVAFATTPAPLPAKLVPLKVPPAPRLQPARPIGPPVTRWTPEFLDSLNLSGTVEFDLLMHLFPNSAVTNSTTSFGPIRPAENPRRFLAVSALSEGESSGQAHHQITAETTAGTTVQATSDSNQDIEPSIITNRFSGVDRTTSVFTKFDANNVPHHYWTSTTDFVNFVGWPTGYELQPPSPTDRSSDPMLSENPYSCTNCAFSMRTYAVGVSYNIVNNATGHSELNVWYSDSPTGQNSWNILPPLDQDDNPIFFDKPSIATSWDQYNGTLGYTYVAAVVVHYDSDPSYSKDLQIYEQTGTGGFTLVNRQFLYLDSTTTSPIITVDSATGDVYLAWIDPQNSVIEIARSTDQAHTFSNPVVVTAQSLVNATCPGDLICDTNIPKHCVKGASVIMARYNPADSSIGVAWHLRESDGNHTDVGFNRFKLATQSWTWYRGIQLGHVGANDGRYQWNPALDPGSSGAYLTVWFDTRNNQSSSLLYQLYAVKTNPDGTPIDTSDTLVYNGNAFANASLLPQIYDGNIGCQRTYGYIGDYQDVWEWFGTWHAATIYMLPNSSQQDVYISTINP